MPLLDHFHPPLRGPRRWEGFHHAWASNIAQHLNREVLPAEYFAESEISLGPATQEYGQASAGGRAATAVWAPSKPALTFPVDFSRLDVCEVRIYEDLGGPQLRAAIELISPSNKDRPGHRRTFAAKCAGYLKHAVSVVIVDAVTERAANLHQEILETLEVHDGAWQAATELYAVAYRPVPELDNQRIEAWPEVLTLGQPLPTLPLWLGIDLSVPLQLEDTYAETCLGLKIPVEHA